MKNKIYILKNQGKGLVANANVLLLKDVVEETDAPAVGDILFDVTYVQLVNLQSKSLLITGQKYRLIDYMTTYIQPLIPPVGEELPIDYIPSAELYKSSGIIEVLHITATDINKLHTICQSELYPQDIIYYEITGDIGNDYGTEGFTKGKIYRRIDTIKNNDIGTDWRHVKYNRNGVDKLLFGNYNFVNDNIIATNFLHNSVFLNGARFNKIGRNFKNNTINGSFVSNTINDGFSNNNIEQGFESNLIGIAFYANTTNFLFTQNTFFGTCGYCIFGENFSDNKLFGTISECIFGKNILRNTFIDSFYTNTVGDLAVGNTFNGFIQNNIIGSNCQNNIINDGCHNNFIGNNFLNNIVGINFKKNGNATNLIQSNNTVFENNIQNIVISTSEMANGNISLTVFKSPNAFKKQRYYDNLNALIIQNL